MDIDKLLEEEIFANELKCIAPNIMLTKKEIEVLDYYAISYKNSSSLKEIILKIEDYLDSYADTNDLEEIEKSIAERDYYNYTNK